MALQSIATYTRSILGERTPAQSAATIAPASTPTLARPLVHLAIIMDGNGRWAKARNLPRLAGHKAGTENVRRILKACVNNGIKILTTYAFSTENWRRPAEEVGGLMKLFDTVLDRELAEIHKNGVQLRHLGRIDRLPANIQYKMQQALALTKNNDRLIWNVALDYGGRAELVDAMKAMIADGVNPEHVTEDTISRYLYTADLPDPDLIVRTSGELRTSNFLLWQSAYSEYYVTDTYWPDFDETELRRAIEQFGRRERRFGGLANK
jgi:undecaprenyl diphosphate synthase